MNILRKNILKSSTFLICAMVIANFLNFVFNAYLGRVLSFEQFALITLINTFLYVFAIGLGAQGATINHRVAYLTARSGRDSANGFITQTFLRLKKISLVLFVLYLLSLPLLKSFFKLTDYLPLISFAPYVLLMFAFISSRAYLQGRFMFIWSAILILIESTTKLTSAIALTLLGLGQYSYFSIILSPLVSGTIAYLLVRYKLAHETVEQNHNFKFKKRFFLAALLTGFSTNAFLTFDVLLVKHYLSIHDSGVYAFLALIGKMIFFFGSLFHVFMIPFVSRDEGSHRNPNQNFYTILAAAVLLTSIMFVFIGPAGDITLPLIFGNKTKAISHVRIPYALAIAAFTIASTITLYHLARRHFSFSVLSMIMTLLMLFGISFSHNSIQNVVDVILYVTLLYLAIATAMHLLQRNGGFIVANIVDFISLFFPLERQSIKKGKLRILIFNWRDTKHVFAGGAEVYVHELGKRWAKDGHAVTVFCGNDTKCPRYESIDGVQIVRRGGFYTVYFWAFVYYVFRFRGKYDIIIDCENGIPFFTPFYAKREKKFLVMHHVHQEVFRKTLGFPLSQIATFLELKLMPLAYRNIQIITVSQSTKDEIQAHALSNLEPIIVPNGVDLKLYKPGQRSKKPFVLYLGRLKAYKTINVFIRAAKEIHKLNNAVRFVIAGEGEEMDKLKHYAHMLNVPIEFLGKVTEDEKVKLYQSAWVVVNPSSMEGWGITVTEANACDTPVVGSDVPGLRDSIKDGYNGYLVKHGDFKDIASHVQKIISNQKLRISLSKNASRFAANYKWSNSANLTIKLFKLKDQKAVKYRTAFKHSIAKV